MHWSCSEVFLEGKVFKDLQHPRKLVCLPNCCWGRWVGDVAGNTWESWDGNWLKLEVLLTSLSWWWTLCRRELGTYLFRGVRSCVAGLHQRIGIISARTCNADHGEHFEKQSMSAWHWQQVPPGLLTARPSQLGPEKSAHSSIFTNMLFDAQATSMSSSDLFTELHCAEEDDAAFFVMPCVEGNSITMGRSDTHTHTHTHTCTHARTHARTHTHVHAHILFP